MADPLKTERIFALITKNLPVGFSIVDNTGIIIEFNRAAEEITGFSRHEVVGKYHFTLLHGSAGAKACPLLQTTLERHEKSIATESIIQKKNGEFITISVTTFPLLDDNGNFLGGVELFRDITEFKKLAKERKNILSMFAHDMKTPVMTSGGLLSRILSGKAGALTDKQHDYLAIVHENLNKVEKLITNFLEFSRLETKEYIPTMESYNIQMAIKKVMDAAWLEAEKKEINLTYVSPVDSPLIIKADAMMVDRVLTNLLMNAIKYTAPQGSVKITLNDREKDILVEISDNGPGIPAIHLPHIFDAFFRVKRDTSGFGLGLSISKIILEAHHGKVWAESTEGKGSTFSFTLPKNKEEENF